MVRDPMFHSARHGVHLSREEFDEGLRVFMQGVYGYMAGALSLTGLIALMAAGSEAFLNAMYVIQGGAITGTKPLSWIVMLAPLGLIFYLSFGIMRMSLVTAQIGFWIYAALVGLSLSTIFLAFTGQSIARVFFITAGVFGGMSLYGYTTKNDLSTFGAFMFMGLYNELFGSLNVPAMLGLVAAFLGILLSQITGIVEFDGIASVIIGLILGGTAVWLAHETKGLLIGESANTRVVEGIREAAQQMDEVLHINEVLTMHVGPEFILVNLSIDFQDELTAPDLEKAIARLDHKIKQAFPNVKRIFVEAESRWSVRPTSDSG